MLQKQAQISLRCLSKYTFCRLADLIWELPVISKDNPYTFPALLTPCVALPTSSAALPTPSAALMPSMCYLCHLLHLCNPFVTYALHVLFKPPVALRHYLHFSFWCKVFRVSEHCTSSYQFYPTSLVKPSSFNVFFLTFLPFIFDPTVSLTHWN
jgi:hypothetical protein